jgi:PAS domain S-box-containing protein
MSKRPDSSIARSAFIGVLLTCLVVMAAWETISLAREWRTRRREVVAAGELVARRLANTLSNPLWNYDREEVGKAAEFEIHSPEVLAVVVENDKGETEAALVRQAPDRVVPFRPGREEGFLLRDSLASSSRPVLKLDKRVGLVTVHVSSAYLRGQLVRAVLSRAGELILLVSAILGVVYLVIARRIIDPISALDRSIAGMPADRPLAIPVVGEGEVRRLAESFNAMAGKLDTAFGEQRRLLGELGNQQELFSSLVSNLPGILFRASPPPERRLHYLSENFPAVTGFARADFISSGGRVLDDLILGEDRPAVNKILQAAVASRVRYDVEYRIRDAAGKVRWMHETGRLVGEDDHGPLWMDGIALDITEAHLKDEQLKQAQRMETVGMLAGGVAHDFNNILGVIMGTTSLMRLGLERGDDLGRGELDESLGRIEEAVDRATALVGQLLSISRRKELCLAPLDLVACLRTVQKLLAGSIDKSISVVVDPVESSAMVVADAGQFEQAVLNLCVNAGHAMTFMRPAGQPWGGTLTLGVRQLRPDPFFLSRHPDAQQRDYWVLSIHDTGVGMDQETLSRLFTPFFTTKEIGRGTGLGLSLVYSIVKSHLGFLSVSSELGSGSTFNIYLPATEVAAATARHPAATGQLPKGSGTVLVVDDEEILRKLATEILEMCGYTVLSATNGEEAVKLFRALSGQIDLVLLDMMMPVMSGREAFLKLREIKPQARILLSSGFRADARVQELIDLGVTGFIDKPYTLRALAQAVDTILGAGKPG